MSVREDYSPYEAIANASRVSSAAERKRDTLAYGLRTALSESIFSLSVERYTDSIYLLKNLWFMYIEKIRKTSYSTFEISMKSHEFAKTESNHANS